MLTRKKAFIVASLLAVALACVAAIPSFLRHAARGTEVAEYIRRHGSPTAVAVRVTNVSHRLRGLRLDGVRLYDGSTATQGLGGLILVYPDTEDATRHFRYLPSEEPMKGERSVHYSQRRMFGDERLVLVRIDEVGRIADVESRRYNWLTLYESSSPIHSD